MPNSILNWSMSASELIILGLVGNNQNKTFDEVLTLSYANHNKNIYLKKFSKKELLEAVELLETKNLITRTPTKLQTTPFGNEASKFLFEIFG